LERRKIESGPATLMSSSDAPRGGRAGDPLIHCPGSCLKSAFVSPLAQKSINAMSLFFSWSNPHTQETGNRGPGEMATTIRGALSLCNKAAAAGIAGRAPIARAMFAGSRSRSMCGGEPPTHSPSSHILALSITTDEGEGRASHLCLGVPVIHSVVSTPTHHKESREI
jgi:hypothetical protein